MTEQQISELIEKLDGVSMMAYEVTVQQQINEAYMVFAIAALAPIAICVCYCSLRELPKVDEPVDFLYLSTAVFSGCLGLIGLAVLPKGIMQYMNPQYYAVMELLEQLPM